jgi:hypothetical protein
VCYDSSLVGMLLTYKNGDVDESGLHCELKGISTNITVRFRTLLTHTFVVVISVRIPESELGVVSLFDVARPIAWRVIWRPVHFSQRTYESSHRESGMTDS